MAQERLQKILAAAGVASRRKAEELITSGRISINGEKVTKLGSKADARSDEIRLDGQLLRGPERHVYIVLHKPKGYVTTVSDPEGRPTVLDLLGGVEARVFPVGRLDYASEGLLLLTNDGALMQQLTKAASHVPKTYQVKVSGTPTEEQMDKLRGGIHLPPETSRAGTMGGTRPGMPRRSQSEHTLPARIDLVRHQDNPWYEITLTEGRNRQIRRMFEQIGHHVEKIKRVRYGALQLDVDPGKWRFLKPREIEALRNPKPPRAIGARSGERGGSDRTGSMRSKPFDKAHAGNRRSAADRTGPGGARPFDKVRGPKGQERGTNYPRLAPNSAARNLGHPQRPTRPVSEPPARRAASEDREFSPHPRGQHPESRRPERPSRQEFGSARERPSRPERGRSGQTRPSDKPRGPKGTVRGERRPSRPVSVPAARRAGSTDREFFSRPRQQRPESRQESRHAERPSRQEFSSAHERPSRPERGRSGAARRGSTRARPFDKARGHKSSGRGEGKSMAGDRRSSRAPGRNPRDKSGSSPGR